jgi:hypothetical protein
METSSFRCFPKIYAAKIQPGQSAEQYGHPKAAPYSGTMRRRARTGYDSTPAGDFAVQVYRGYSINAATLRPDIP